MNLSLEDLELISKRLHRCQGRLQKHIEDIKKQNWKVDCIQRRENMMARRELPLPKIVIEQKGVSSYWKIADSDIRFQHYICSNSELQEYIIKDLQSIYLMDPIRTRKVIYVIQSSIK